MGKRINDLDFQKMFNNLEEMVNLWKDKEYDYAFQHSGFEIIYHYFFWNCTKKTKRILMTSQKMLHGLGQGKFKIHQPAVTQHHDKKTQSAWRCMDGSPAAG